VQYTRGVFFWILNCMYRGFFLVVYSIVLAEGVFGVLFGAFY